MASSNTAPVELRDGDALIVVDVQNDFLPGGALGVGDGDAVIPLLNGYIERFTSRDLPIFATRDWHPVNHCSFTAQGGPWPVHCVQGTRGAEFAADLHLPERARQVAKAIGTTLDSYSGFEGTDLAAQLHAANSARLFVGGLATDYCILNTVIDGLREGFTVFLLEDAVRAVNVRSGDGSVAIARMLEAGAHSLTLEQLA